MPLETKLINFTQNSKFILFQFIGEKTWKENRWKFGAISKHWNQKGKNVAK